MGTQELTQQLAAYMEQAYPELRQKAIARAKRLAKAEAAGKWKKPVYIVTERMEMNTSAFVSKPRKG